MKEEES